MQNEHTTSLLEMDCFVKNKVPVTSEGVMPFMRWVVEKKAK